MPHLGTSSEFQRREDKFKTRHYVIQHTFLRHILSSPVEIRCTRVSLSPPFVERTYIRRHVHEHLLL